jgi:hypothetical protein
MEKLSNYENHIFHIMSSFLIQHDRHQLPRHLSFFNNVRNLSKEEFFGLASRQ